jgi:acyl-CoA thioesterase
MATDESTVPAELRLAKRDDQHFELEAKPASERDVVNGVQLMAYSIAAACDDPASALFVKSAHGVFMRPALRTSTTMFDIDRFHTGRAFGAATVTVTQDRRTSARVQLLLHADEPDVIQHADAMPDVPGPDDCPPFTASGAATPGFDIRVVGDPDYMTIGHAPQQPELRLWVRYADPVARRPVNQALLTNCTGTTLIGTAMLPHSEIGQEQAHRTLSTGVIGHTIAFHEPFSVDDWLLLDQRSIQAGHGRVHGRARVFDQGGRLVASYVQDAMIRQFHDGQDHSDQHRTVM